MILTNRFNLPAPVMAWLSYDAYGPRQGDISVTELIQPPQVLELGRLHDHEIVYDASDYSLIRRRVGQAVHNDLKRAALAAENVLAEERLFMDVAGWRVTGQADLYEIIGIDQEGAVVDYKVTSVWSIVHGSRDREWAAQLNLYAELFRRHGFDVTSLAVIPFLPFDWKADRAQKAAESPGDRYPPAPSFRYSLPLWSEEKAQSYLGSRVALHQNARKHHRWPPCSPEERWYHGEEWKVYLPTKGGRPAKRATAVFGAEAPRGGGGEDAIFFLNDNDDTGKGRVEHVPGVSRRCQGYCDARPWCDQAKAIAKDEDWAHRAPEVEANTNEITLEDAQKLLKSRRKR